MFQRSIKTRTIGILDANDNKPVFQQKSLQAEVVEVRNYHKNHKRSDTQFAVIALKF